MRLALMLICAALIGACGPGTAYVEVGPSYPANPAYVYVDEGGGCWANDVWYDRCRWTTPGLGLYWWSDGRYVYRPGYVWRDHRAPPPRQWHPYRPPARPPVIIRDHRHH